MKKRLVGCGIGIFVALVVNLLAVLSTGGGHGSFNWLFVAVVPNVGGLYFILMTAIAVELNTSRLRWIFGIALAVNWIISLVILAGGYFSDEYTIRAFQREPWSSIMLTGLILLPNIFYNGILVRSSRRS